MILFILEIMMFGSGVYMLCAGRTIGKDSVQHPQVRLLGGLLMCQLPFALVSVVVIALVAVVVDPAAARTGTLPTWAIVTSVILEWGSYLLCAWVWAYWTRRIKAKFAPPLAPPSGSGPLMMAPRPGPAPEEHDAPDGEEEYVADDEGEYEGGDDAQDGTDPAPPGR